MATDNRQIIYPQDDDRYIRFIPLFSSCGLFMLFATLHLIDAFILGIVIYGVYETTTYAILEKWSPLAVILDTFWGGLLFTLTTYISYKIL